MSDRELRAALERAQSELRRVEAERDSIAKERDALEEERALLRGRSDRTRSERALSRALLDGTWPHPPFSLRWSGSGGPVDRFLSTMSRMAPSWVFAAIGFSIFARAFWPIPVISALWGGVALAMVIHHLKGESRRIEFGDRGLSVVRSERGELSLVTTEVVEVLVPYCDIVRVGARGSRLTAGVGDVIIDLADGQCLRFPMVPGYLLIATWLDSRRKELASSPKEAGEESQAEPRPEERALVR